jgi:hypothetical protein
MCTHQVDVYSILRSREPQSTPVREHDWLCTLHSNCMCDLIEKVRADERSVALVSNEAREVIDTAFRNGYRKGLKDGVEFADMMPMLAKEASGDGSHRSTAIEQ